MTDRLDLNLAASGIWVMTLNRPEAMNALSTALRKDVVAALDRLRDEPGCRVLILTGAGKAFCAGLDLRELGGDASGLASIDRDDPVTALSQFPKPVIVAVNGAAVTGGLELALAGDFRIASATARFADTHAQVGVMPGWGLSQRLSRLIGIGRAKQMSFMGQFVSAAQALDWGLVNEVVEQSDLMPRAIAIASGMLKAAPGMLEVYKSIIDDGYAKTFGDALTEELARSIAFNTKVSAQDIESRRGEVVARGRASTGKAH